MDRHTDEVGVCIKLVCNIPYLINFEIIKLINMYYKKTVYSEFNNLSRKSKYNTEKAKLTYHRHV